MAMKQIDGYKVYLGKMKGQGTYGAVYEGLNDITKQKVAIKLLKKSSIDADDYLKAALFSEIKILQSVKSPNIVGFEDVMESSQYYYVIQELCDCDLGTIMKPGVCQPEDKAIEMLIHISNGFLALVREGIIHRDLKPANIMIKKGVLKIGDFGFAKRVPNKKVGNKTVVGTPLYMSLQILKGEEYSSKADIWAIGFIFYELLHGDTPWTAQSEYQLVKCIQSKPIKTKHGLDPNTVDFIKRCLQRQEKDRISWDEYFLHPIFKGYFDSYATQNKQFENKMKSVMSELRFRINSQNLDLCKILFDMGYQSPDTQMKFPEFMNFLRAIRPQISQQQAVYMFQKMDTNNSGTISINEIEQQMSKHNINLHSTYNHMPIFEKKETESFQTINVETQQKIKGCFRKMEEVIRRKGISLYNIFTSFDKDKSGKMTFKEWKYMITRLSKEFTDDELQSVFDLIDQDNSNTIEFEQLNRYYSKVNGIPEFLNNQDIFNHTGQKFYDKQPQPQEQQKMDVENRNSREQGSQGNQGNQGNPIFGQQQFQQHPPPIYNQQYPQQYPQQQNSMHGHQPQYGYYYPHPCPPYQHSMPLIQPMQQSNGSGEQMNNQNKGIFGNFIFNQLSNGLNNSGGYRNQG